jgi:hypothetical protein
MRDYLLFRKFITPIVIELLFWLGIGLCLAEGIAMIAFSAGRFGNGFGIFSGILTILIGPIVVRVACELIMAIFGIHESLKNGSKQ